MRNTSHEDVNRHDRIKIANETLSALLLQGEDDPLHQLHAQHPNQGEDDGAKKVYVDWPENDDFEYRFVSSRVDDYGQDDNAVPRSPEPYDSLNADAYAQASRAPPPPAPDPSVPLDTYTGRRHSSRTVHHTPMSYHSTGSNASQKRISPKKNTVTPMPEPRRKEVTSDEEEAQLLEEERRYQNVLRQRVQENEERDNEFEIPPLHLGEIEQSGDFILRESDDVMEISVRSNHVPFPETIPQYKMPAGVAKLSDFVDSLDTEIDRWEEKGDHADANEIPRTNEDDQSLPYNRRENFQVISPRQDQSEPQRSERARSIPNDAQPPRRDSRQARDHAQPEHGSRQRGSPQHVPTQQSTYSQSPGPAQRVDYGSPQQERRANSKESYHSMRRQVPRSPQRQYSPQRPSRAAQDSDMSSRDSSVARPRPNERERSPPRHYEREYADPQEQPARGRHYERAPPMPVQKRNPPVPYEHYPTEQDYPDNNYPEETYPASYDYPYGDAEISPKRTRPLPRQNAQRPPNDERHYRPNGYHRDPVEGRDFYREAHREPDSREVRHQASSPFLPPVHDDVERRRRYSDASVHDSQIRPNQKLRQSHRSMEEIYSARRDALESQRRKMTDRRPPQNATNFVEKNKQTYGFAKRESGYASYYSRKQEQHSTNSAPSRILSRKPPLPGIKPRSQRDEYDDSASDRTTAAQDPEKLWAQRSKALSKRADPKRSPQKRNEAVQADMATRTPSGPSRPVPSNPSQPKLSSGQGIGDERSESKISGRTMAEPQKVSIDLNVNITPQGFQIPHHAEAYVKHAPGPQQIAAGDEQPSQYIRPYADPYVLDKAFRSPRDLQLQERTPSDLDKLVYSQTATNPFTPLPPIANERNEEDEEPVKGGYLAMFRKDQNVKQGVEKPNYKPYSFNDFKRMPKEVKLGGLGPDVDSETHKEKMEKRLRAEQYARQAHERNLQRLRAARPKLSPRVVAQEQMAMVAPPQQVVHRQPPPRDVFSPSIVVKTSRRQAAIDYAKRLQRPPSTKTRPKPKSNRQNEKPAKPQQPEPELIDLQRLLERHERDKENVATVRAKLLEV